jgi:hypothetical protein
MYSSPSIALQNQLQWNTEIWVSFTKGPRIYYTQFSLSHDGRFVKYGSPIYKQDGGVMDLTNHFQTAKERFSRFPVIAPISEKIFNEMESIKTRRSKTIFFESKKFTDFLIQTFVKHGVRHREGKHSYSSLRKKMLDNRQAIISKKRRIITNKTNAAIEKNEKKRKLMIKGFQGEKKGYSIIHYHPEQLPEINPKLTYNMVIWEEGSRIYHVDIQHDPKTGEARYGACVFKSVSLEDCQNYDQEIHIDTAVDRFENFPILANLPLNYEGQNKKKMAKGEFPLNKENMEVIQKALCIFGARKRNIDDNFLKKQELMQKQASSIKKLNRLQQKLDSDVSSYKNNTFKHKMEEKRQQWINFTQNNPQLNPEKFPKKTKIVFVDSPPIILNKNKKIPTPPNSPTTQRIIDQVYKQNEKKKTNKGYKDKSKSVQKRKAIDQYKKDKISKERKNAEKTKEKQTRRENCI